MWKKLGYKFIGCMILLGIIMVPLKVIGSEDQALHVVITFNEEGMLSQYRDQYESGLIYDAYGLGASEKSIMMNLQDKQIKNLRTAYGDFEVGKRFTRLFSGVEVIISEATYHEMKDDPNLTGVYLVETYLAPEPMLTTSSDMVGVPFLHDYGYQGEGSLVAIIDTGIDKSHEAMVLAPETEVKLTKDMVASKTGLNGAGAYMTLKMPYAYNYYDQNMDVIDSREGGYMHGMHVAGIVGADHTLIGIAPKTQILNMKVFSNEAYVTSTNSLILVHAIEDALLLGADVINMSLGSTAGNVDGEAIDQVAIRQAYELGVAVCVSAGNSGYLFESEGTFVENTDTGSVGSPGVAAYALQVGAVNNMGTYYEYIIQDTLEGKLSLTGYGADLMPDSGEILITPQSTYGVSEDYEGLDVNGRLVLLDRGDSTFFEKARVAAEHGAVGILLVDTYDFVSIKNIGGNPLPIALVSAEAGLLLRSQGMSILDVSISAKAFVDQSSGQVATYSAYGPTPQLTFKPQIVAPGTKIYSTLNNQSYGIMTGTSMAAPHVAGGMALLKEVYLESDYFLTMSPKDRLGIQMATLMNTAQAIYDERSQTLASPRVQGAGLMDLEMAIRSRAYVLDSLTMEAYSLPVWSGPSQMSWELEMTNWGQEVLEFDIEAVTLIPRTIGGRVYPQTKKLEAVTTFTVDGQIQNILRLGPSELKRVQVSLSLNEESRDELVTQWPNGCFVEGFISFIARDDQQGDLSIPYLSYYGNWQNQPGFDIPIYQADEGLLGRSFFNRTGLYTSLLDVSGNLSYGYLGYYNQGYDLDRIVVSPNGDGYNDDIIPVVSLLRNMRSLRSRIFDEDNELVWESLSTSAYRKQISLQTTAYILESLAWQGQSIANEVPDDGVYTYYLEGNLAYDGSLQTLAYPIVIDTTKPEDQGSYYDQQNDRLMVYLKDGDLGIYKITYYTEAGTILREVLGKTEDIFLTDRLPNQSLVRVVALDYGGNEMTMDIRLDKVTDPLTYELIIQPSNQSWLDSRDFVLWGSLMTHDPLVNFKINGEEVTLKTGQDGFLFEEAVRLEEEGIQTFLFEVSDANKKVMAVTYLYYLDITNPAISVIFEEDFSGVVNPDGTYRVPYTTNHMDVLIQGLDNGPYLQVSRQGLLLQEVGSKVEVTDFTASRLDYPESLVLNVGANLFPYILTDGAGNQVTYLLSVYRESAPPPPPPPSDPPPGPGPIPVPIPIPVPVTLDIMDETLPLASYFQHVSYINGYPDRTFRPENALKRSEISKMLTEVLSLTKQQTSNFKDLGAGYWAREYIGAMEKEGYVRGYEDGSFRPEGMITRGELATILNRIRLAMNLPQVGDANNHTYRDLGGHWAEPAVKDLLAFGMTLEVVGPSFNPDRPVTRSEAVSWLNALTGRTKEVVDLSPISFTDLEESYWAYEAIAIAVGQAK